MDIPVLNKEVQEVNHGCAATGVFVGLGFGIIVMLGLLSAVICCDLVGAATAEPEVTYTSVMVESPKTFVLLPDGDWAYPESDQCAYDTNNPHRVLLVAGEPCRRWAMEHPYHCSVNLEERFTRYTDDLFVSVSSDGPRLFFVDDIAAPQAVVARVDCD
jgi:hypothetical protein